MDRRVFLKSLAVPSLAGYARASSPRTKHLIFIVPDGLRKQEYLGPTSEMRNVSRLAREGFVFEEDHCEQVASHDAAFNELIRGVSSDSEIRPYPTILDYIGRGIELTRIASIPTVLAMRRPRI